MQPNQGSSCTQQQPSGQTTYAPSVKFSHPKDATNVPGGGLFSTWGRYNGTFTNIRVVVTHAGTTNTYNCQVFGGNKWFLPQPILLNINASNLVSMSVIGTLVGGGEVREDIGFTIIDDPAP